MGGGGGGAAAGQVLLHTRRVVMRSGLSVYKDRSTTVSAAWMGVESSHCVGVTPRAQLSGPARLCYHRGRHSVSVQRCGQKQGRRSQGVAECPPPPPQTTL